ncbi:MAG: CRISPR system precrRNA processing endoribonuclease RAMP protein Cas6 [Actinomycetia bacterium]|nr:CRISPR system precrRNA processing endoribonuclease RAMP protein Cas6 [Actinomycetes bacterium]
MPESWFVPLRLVPPVKPDHLHAALSRWFDVGTEDLPDRHHDTVKPYTVSPLTERDGWGVEVSTLTAEASWRLAVATRRGPEIRLGRQVAAVGRPVRLARASWSELAEVPPRRSWEVEFLTPTTFRTGQRASPFPDLRVVLRGPQVCWDAYSQRPPRLHPPDFRALWVADVELQTVQVPVRATTVPAALGRLEIRCDDPAVARAVAPLLALAPYCGVGSFRGKGFGVVRVSAA